MGMFDTVLRDLRFSLRTLAKAPTFTVAVVATIALALGATTAMFAVVDGILLRPLPFPGSDRTFALCETNPGIGDWCGASPMNVADWARATRALEEAGVARTEPLVAHDGSGSYSVRGGIASPGFFRVLGLRPMLGRLIEERDLLPGANHVALVSHAFWKQRLGGTPGALGRLVTIDESPYSVIGVLPADGYLPEGSLDRIEVWKPLTASVDDVSDRNWRGFTAIGRSAPGISRVALMARLETVRAGLAAEYPGSNKDWGLRIVGLREHLVGDVRSTLWIFLGAVGFVLLIACANVAGLLLVRATGRASEFAVRASLGASRKRLAQQLVTESLLLSLAGGALGLLLASWATAAFVAVAPGTIPRLGEVTIDGRIALFALLLAAATALVFGLAPAGRASLTDLTGALKGRRATSGADTRLRSAFVVAQIALALMLLVGAGLLTRGFGRLLQRDLGFERANLVTTWMLPPVSLTNKVATMEQVRDEVAAIPGVRSAALTSTVPLFGGEETGGLAIEGRPPIAPKDAPTVQWFDTGPHYFETLGVKIRRGRAFTVADVQASAAVSVVNETFARRFFGGQDPIGQRVTVEQHASQIVGVVADVNPLRPDQPTLPQIYWPIEQYRRGAAYLILRTTPGITGIEKAVRARAAAVNGGIQLSEMISLDERFSKRLTSPRFSMLLVVTFALVAMLLAAVGVYGVIAYAVASRTRELGVRIALGALPGRLVVAVLRRGMMLTGIGIAAGCAGALAVGRLLTSLLYGLPATDPVALAGAVALLALAATVACWVPARRASRVDPVSALRAD
jgi:putative ABC transport system permease protein